MVLPGMRKQQHLRVGDLSLEDGARIKVMLVGAKVCWEDDQDRSQEDQRRFCYCVAHEQGVDDGEMMDEELGTTRPTESANLHRHMEWHWRTTFEVAVSKLMRVELWELHNLYGHSYLGSVLVPIQDLQLEPIKESQVTRIEVALEPSEEEGDGIREGTVLLELHSDPQALLATPSEDTRDRTSRLTSAGRLGVLRVIVWQGMAIHSNKRPTSVHVHLDNQWHMTADSTANSTKSSPVYDASFEFDVFDITKDLRIKVMERTATRRKKVIGQVIIPLTSLIDKWHAKPPRDQWYEVLPAIEEAFYNRFGQYRTAMSGTRAEGFGLPRPDEPLGFLKLGTELRLAKPAPLIYLSPPVMNARGGDRLSSFGGRSHEKINLAAIKTNMRRIERCLKAAPLWILDVLDEFRWRSNPLHSCALLVTHAYVCLWMPLWQTPLALVGCLVFLGAATGTKRSFNHVYIYQDEIYSNIKGRGYDTNLQKDLQERYRRYKVLAKKVQYQTEILSSFMEKVVNLVTWSDWRVSLIASVALTVIAGIFSAVLFVARNHVRELWFYSGLFLFRPQSRRRARKRSHSLWKGHQQMQTKLPGARDSRDKGGDSKELVPVAEAEQAAAGGGSNGERRSITSDEALSKVQGSLGKDNSSAHQSGLIHHSGYLFSKSWAGGHLRLNDLLEGKGGMWRRRWCQLASNPPRLVVKDISDPGPPVIPEGALGTESRRRSSDSIYPFGRMLSPIAPRVPPNEMEGLSQGPSPKPDSNRDSLAHNENGKPRWRAPLTSYLSNLSFSPNKFYRTRSTYACSVEAPARDEVWSLGSAEKKPSPIRARRGRRRSSGSCGSSDATDAFDIWSALDADGQSSAESKKCGSFLSRKGSLEETPGRRGSSGSRGSLTESCTTEGTPMELDYSDESDTETGIGSEFDTSQEGVNEDIDLTGAIINDTGKSVAISLLSGMGDSDNDLRIALRHKATKSLKDLASGKGRMRLFEVRIPMTRGGDMVLFLATAVRGERRQWIRAMKSVCAIDPITDVAATGDPKSTALTALLGGESQALNKAAKQQGGVVEAIESQVNSAKMALLHLFASIPDDMDLEHRYICQRQAIADDEVRQRLPDKTLMSQDERLMALKFMNRRASTGAVMLNINELRITLVGGQNLHASKPQLGHQLLGLLKPPDVRVVLFISPTEACPLKFRSSSKGLRSSPIWREDFSFKPLKSTAASLCLEVHLKKTDIRKERVIGYGVVPLVRFIDKEVHELSVPLGHSLENAQRKFLEYADLMSKSNSKAKGSASSGKGKQLMIGLPHHPSCSCCP
ncbi:unnamed protein product [Chrysoparadoxa australica]